MTSKIGFPLLNTAYITAPREYISLAVSQLTERMYSGARYSGFGRHKDGKFGSHSLQGNLGYKRTKKQTKKELMNLKKTNINFE